MTAQPAPRKPHVAATPRIPENRGTAPGRGAAEGRARPVQPAPPWPRRATRCPGAAPGPARTAPSFVVAVVAASIAGALLVFGLATALGAATPEGVPGSDAADAVVPAAVVRPGDTLWDIAVRHAPPGTDPRAYLAALQANNGGRASVVVGASIELPPP